MMLYGHTPIRIMESDRYAQLERRINQLVDENRLVNQHLSDNAAQIDSLRATNAKMEIELNRLRGQDHEIALMMEVSELRHKEAETNRVRVNQLVQDLGDLQKLYQEAQQQIKKQQTQLANAQNEAQFWKKKCEAAEQSHQKQSEQMRNEMQQRHIEEIKLFEQDLMEYRKQFDESQQELQEMKRELNAWKIKYSKIQVSQKLKAKECHISQQSQPEIFTEEHIVMLIEEIEILNARLVARNEEIAQQKLLIQAASEYMPQLQEEIRRLRSQQQKP